MAPEPAQEDGKRVHDCLGAQSSDAELENLGKNTRVLFCSHSDICMLSSSALAHVGDIISEIRVLI